MYTACTHASSVAARAGRAVLVPGRLHKVLGDSQSWVVVLGKERDQQPKPFPGRAPGRSGGFGLSGPLLVLSRAALGWEDAHMSPPPWRHRGSGLGCSSVRALQCPAAQCQPEPRKHMWLETQLWMQSRETCFPGTRGQYPGCRLVPCSPPTEGRRPSAGHSRQAPRSGTRAVSRARRAGQTVSARCTACTWRCSPRPPGP